MGIGCTAVCQGRLREPMSGDSYRCAIVRASFLEILGVLEDCVAESGWAWNAVVSAAVDALVLAVEGF